MTTLDRLLAERSRFEDKAVWAREAPDTARTSDSDAVAHARALAMLDFLIARSGR